MHYQISNLEKITGVKAHTIRIWEKRYGLIQPYRTDTNIRYYDDDQLVKLLNVCTLVESGFKISKIALLNNEELIEERKKLFNGAHKETKYLVLTNELLTATLNYDEASFNRIYQNIVQEFGVYNAMLNVLYPFLNRLGMLWLTNEVFPAKEHFVSNLIRRKLSAEIDRLMIPINTSKKFLLFLPPNEWHDIGLLFSELLIRSQGFETINLGQNVPLEKMELVVSEINPTHILTFFIANKQKEEVNMVLNSSILFSNGKLLLIGGVSDALEIGDILPRNVKLLNKPFDLYEYL